MPSGIVRDSGSVRERLCAFVCASAGTTNVSACSELDIDQRGEDAGTTREGD